MTPWSSCRQQGRCASSASVSFSEGDGTHEILSAPCEWVFDVVMLTVNFLLQTAIESVLPLLPAPRRGHRVMMPLNQASKQSGLVSVSAALECVRRHIAQGNLPAALPYTDPQLFDFLQPYSIPAAGLRFVLAQPVSTCCVGMRTPERLVENLQVVQPPYLDARRQARLRELFAASAAKSAEAEPGNHDRPRTAQPLRPVPAGRPLAALGMGFPRRHHAALVPLRLPEEHPRRGHLDRCLRPRPRLALAGGHRADRHRGQHLLRPGFGDQNPGRGCGHVTRRDGWGAVARHSKMGASIPQYLSFGVHSRQDFAEYASAGPDRPGPLPRGLAGPHRAVADARLPVRLHTHGWYGLLRELMGVEGLSVAFFDQPDLIEEISEFWGDFLIATVRRALADCDVDYVLFWEDLATRPGRLLSPAMFRRFFLPHYQRVIGHWRGRRRYAPSWSIRMATST